MIKEEAMLVSKMTPAREMLDGAAREDAQDGTKGKGTQRITIALAMPEEEQDEGFFDNHIVASA